MKLPNFLCVGAQKCATTSLYEVLKGHPEVSLSKYKEPNFFSLEANYGKGIDWYLETYFSDNEGKKAIGEFTPIYLYHPMVPARIREHLGNDVKFVAMIRNPLDRAHSQYLHNVRDQLECESFEMALNLEPDRLEQFKIPENSDKHSRFAYRGMSDYAAGVRRYLKEFPLESFFFIVVEEDFCESKRDETVKKLLGFLGVDQNVKLDLNINANPASVPRIKCLKKILYGKNFIRSMARTLVFHPYLRQTIKSRINKANHKRAEKSTIEKTLRGELMDRFFRAEIAQFETIIGRKILTWREEK